jgi:hypothetical protein
VHDALMGIGGAVLGGLIAVLLHRWNLNPLTNRVRSDTEADGDEIPDTPEIVERLEGVEKAQRMLLGRLNRVAPPRQGTGNGPEPPDVTETPLPPSKARAQVLQEYRRRHGR